MTYSKIIFFSYKIWKIGITLFLITLSLAAYAQQLSWSSFTTISSNADGYGRPRIALTSNNDPLIIWRKDSSPKVLRASKWDGNNFSAPYDILQPGILPSSWDGPELAVKGDTVYVVFTSNATSQSSIMLIKSFDGGLTFSDTIRVSENNPAHKFRMGNVVVKEDGNPVVSYMQYLLNWMEPKQMVNSSMTFGGSFIGATEGSALAPGEPCDCCKSSLISSGNNLFLLFRNNDNNERNSYVAKSIDGGVSFIATADMDDYDWILNACPATTPRGIVLGDSLVIVKRSGATGNNEIVCSSIDMGGLTYSYNNNIDLINGALQDYPEIAGNKDTVVAVWQDDRTGLQNCYVSVSTNGAVYLKGSIPFTDSSTIGHKHHPDVAHVNGDMHLVYLDYSQHKIVYTKASFNLINKMIDLPFQSNKTIKSIDVLGRDVKEKSRTPLFYLHEDGTVKKRIIVN